MNAQPYVHDPNCSGCPQCSESLAENMREGIRGDFAALSARLERETRLRMRKLASDGRTVDGPPDLASQIREHRRGNRPDRTYEGYERSVPKAADLPELEGNLTTTQPINIGERIRGRK